MTNPTVCVAICTHNRPRQLRALLDGLLLQTHAQPFPVIIVDNGSVPADDTVQPYRDRLPITMEHIPQAGLAAVRNRALRLGLNQGCDFLAFIDDDEVPVPDWLTALLRRQAETNADLVFGPVLATYRTTPPVWVTAGGFFERWGDTPGSGNALIRLAILSTDESSWFLPAYGATGGEDAEFFDRMVAQGSKSAVASEAVAFEDTPPARTTVRFIWRRGLRDGAVTALRIRLGNDPLWRKLWRGTCQVLAKLGFAFAHFAQAPFAPWHAVRGIADLGSAIAIPLQALGYDFHFYGQKPARKRGTG